MERRGFTLIELLVVITVIAILAGILIPTVAIIQHNARIAKSTNNLKQIGGAIEAYKTDQNNYEWPLRLGYLVDSDYGLGGGGWQVLIDPLDSSHGANPYMGRPEAWGDWCVPLHENDPQGAVDKLSYVYECGGEMLNGDPPSEDHVLEWFYRFPEHFEVPERVSWTRAKRHQLNFGNFGAPFPASRFPILRSFHAHSWTGTDEDKYLNKVLNLSYNLEVFWSYPTWELQANPRYEDLM